MDYTLTEDRVKHIASVKKMMDIIVEGEDIVFKNKAKKIALLHDIGYASEINVTGNHAIDGYNHLKRVGVDMAICRVVLYHTNAKELCAKELEVYYSNELLQKEDKKLYDLITYCDTHVNDRGEFCNIDDRYKRIVSRYGEEHIASKVFKANMLEYKRIEKRIEGDMRWV